MNENPKDSSTKGSRTEPSTSGAAGGRQDAKVQGEGDYEATHRYQKEIGDFMQSADIDELAHEAAPRSKDEEQQMLSAEERGRERSKGDDPADLKEMSTGAAPRPPRGPEGASRR
jgi:hypothetical protein